MKDIEILNKIVDVVLSYKPKKKVKKQRRNTKRGKKV
jgi:hypothetical protein